MMRVTLFLRETLRLAQAQESLCAPFTSFPLCLQSCCNGLGIGCKYLPLTVCQSVNYVLIVTPLSLCSIQGLRGHNTSSNNGITSCWAHDTSHGHWAAESICWMLYVSSFKLLE